MDYCRVLRHRSMSETKALYVAALEVSLAIQVLSNRTIKQITFSSMGRPNNPL